MILPCEKIHLTFVEIIIGDKIHPVWSGPSWLASVSPDANNVPSFLKNSEWKSPAATSIIKSFLKKFRNVGNRGFDWTFTIGSSPWT